MSASDHYDCIIIGSGQGGTPLARALPEAGRRTALIERAHIGGTCVNEGVFLFPQIEALKMLRAATLVRLLHLG